MNNPVNAPEWMAKVEETLIALRWADREAQEGACKLIGERHGKEAADKLRELFEIEHAKVARFVDRHFGPEEPKKAAKLRQPVWPAEEAKPKPDLAKQRKAALKRSITEWPKEWPEAPLPPANATEFDKLLYPRGLLGHAVQFVMDTNPLPDRKLALAVALSACAKGLDRKVIGPTGSSTVLFNLIIAETGAGKHHGISCSRALLRAMGLERSIQASGLASVQAIEEIIEGLGDKINPNPNALVVIDEVGSWLARILSESQGGNVSEIPAILQSLWGQPSQDAWIGTKKVGKEMKTFYAVAFSIIGFSTEKMFFRALKDKLISSGFVNRMLLFDVGRGALERVDPKYHWTECPLGLRRRCTK